MTVLIEKLSVELAPRDLLSAWLLGYGSIATRDAYRTDLEQWGRFLVASGVTDPLEATRPLVDGWSRSLELRGLRPASVARKLASLASYYEWLEEEGLIDRNPVQRVRRPRVDSRPSTGLDREELRSFLRAAHAAGRRDHCLALLLALTGLRVTSALQIDTCDLSSERGHRTVAVKGKGLKEQIIPLAAPVAAAVDRLIEEKNDDEREGTAGREGSDGDPRRDLPSDRSGVAEVEDQGGSGVHAGGRLALFTTSTGQRLDRWAAFRVVRRLAAQAGIEKPISPHSLRSSYCQIALDAGAGLHDVQQSMAHSDPKTTIGYLHSMGNLDCNPTYLVASVVAE